MWIKSGLKTDQVQFSHIQISMARSRAFSHSLSLHRPKPIWPKPLSPATGDRLNLHSHTSMAPPTATTSHSEMALTLGFLPPKTHSLSSREVSLGLNQMNTTTIHDSTAQRRHHNWWPPFSLSLALSYLFLFYFLISLFRILFGFGV